MHGNRLTRGANGGGSAILRGKTAGYRSFRKIETGHIDTGLSQKFYAIYAKKSLQEKLCSV
jgi:hypothetical protein